MQEAFLHYLWVNKKIPFTQLQTHLSENLEILHFGQYLQQAGPDIFNAQIIINNQKWAGNIEIHVKSSDWFLHHHENDTNYNNVILHVVWEYDTPVYNKNNLEIPVLELKHYIGLAEINSYKALMASKSWINCENNIAYMHGFIWNNWLEKLFINRLERKATEIEDKLIKTQNNWEAVFVEMLAKSFGLNTNGIYFSKIINSISFSIIRKEATEVENLEALFFGVSNFLSEDIEDIYYKKLQEKWKYYKVKYQLIENDSIKLQFFKHRPDNFPTIRISQLANLLVKKNNLFSNIINTSTYIEIKSLLICEVSSYWKNHFTFSKESKFSNKKVSTDFINLLIINTVLPIKFSYAKSISKYNIDELILLLEEIPTEKNSIIQKFSQFGVESKNAFQSQALLELKNENCSKNNCLNCTVGLQVLKN